MRKFLISSLVAMFAITPMVSAEVGGSVTRNVGVESQVDSINLMMSDDSDEVMWEVSGESKMGFKVVWSKNAGPEYPPRAGDQVTYKEDSDSNEANIKPFDGAGVYFVRVCEYLEGVCGTYSNEIQIEFSETEDEDDDKYESEEYEKEEQEEDDDDDRKYVFSDLSEENENYSAVKYLYEKKVVKGYDDGSFKAYKTINRAEFLKILMELSEYEVSGENCFSDVSDQWFAPYICTAAELGLVKGYDDGTFRPAKDINFAEASKIIVNTLALETDGSNDETWYHSYVSAMELLSAIPTSIDKFDKDITRGEMSEMVYRIHAKKTGEKSTSYRELSGEKEVMGESTISSIVLSDLGDNKVEWSVEGVSPQGFKVVWSKKSGPEYPSRDGDQAQYRGEKSARDAYIKAFDGAGTYSVRVCDYFDGECSVYSNEIKVELK